MDRQDLQLLLTSVVTSTCLLWYRYQYLSEDKVHESAQSGRTYLNEILTGHPHKCLDIFRMSSGCFLLLVNELKQMGHLRDSHTVSAEEQLAIFLFTVGHSQRNRVMQNLFQHSGETISRYFNLTLDAIVKLAPYYVKQFEGECPPEIANNHLFYPSFKTVHISQNGLDLKIKSVFAIEKGGLSQNVIVVVSFDMCFQYICVGWEGSASNSKILQHVVWRRAQNRLRVPTGYANTQGFLAPSHGVLYHLKEWSITQAPKTEHELFNLRHAKLCIIQQFALLQTPPKISYQTQVKIVVACCVIHNFIRQWNLDDELLKEALNEMMEEADLNDEQDHDIEEGNVAGPSDVDKKFMTYFRENISKDMWEARGKESLTNFRVFLVFLL
ncbi:putative nuclease HARBI1 [Cinnamomum micranthum f. kanehirae]|uniref:Putative nuclease HARBI1 n=1 Tax=Cinnamomum micranthum f. kanehirae TaxID=337451 RepID=A0A3S3NBD8_9MAGN|nr:putative nuclease HARBI1 [Cinnamomum micranthum f. kanehirae]